MLVYASSTYALTCFCFFCSFLLIDLILASELPDADEEGGSDGEAEFGAFPYIFFQ